jgi:predicted DNA-binding transcriptional regulator AlpA
MLKRKRRAVLAKKGVLLQAFYTRKELARALGFSIVTIARMDASGTGPPSIKIGGIRLYRKAAVQEWLERTVQEAEGRLVRTKPEKKK